MHLTDTTRPNASPKWSRYLLVEMLRAVPKQRKINQVHDLWHEYAPYLSCSMRSIEEIPGNLPAPRGMAIGGAGRVELPLRTSPPSIHLQTKENHHSTCTRIVSKHGFAAFSPLTVVDVTCMRGKSHNRDSKRNDQKTKAKFASIYRRMRLQVQYGRCARLICALESSSPRVHSEVAICTTNLHNKSRVFNEPARQKGPRGCIWAGHLDESGRYFRGLARLSPRVLEASRKALFLGFLILVKRPEKE